MGDVLGYCGMRLQSASGYVNTSASQIEADWNTGVGLNDDGETRVMVWGNTEGNLRIFDLETTEVPNAVHKVVNNYSTALTVIINTRIPGGSPVPVITFTSCLYQTGAVDKRLRPLADRYVIEGATDFKVFKINS